MNKFILSTITFVSAAILTSCGGSGEEAEEDDPLANFEEYSIEQFYESFSVYGGVFSDDETKMLYTSKEPGISNVFEIDLATNEHTQITFSEVESYYAIDYVPNSDNILYSADQGGNELNHIYLLDAEGNSTDLTPGESERASFYGWSKDEAYMYFTSNRRNPQFMDIYKMSVDTWEAELVFKNDDNWGIGDITDDGRYVVVSETVTTSENELFIIDLESNMVRKISDEKGSYGGSGFNLDQTKFYYTSNAKGNYTKLYEYDMETFESSVLYETDWDVSYSFLSETDKYRVIVSNVDGANELQVIDQASGENVSLPEFEDGDIAAVSISKSETQMRLSVASSIAPANLYLYDFETEELTKLTETLNPDINPDNLVASEVVRFESFDGLEIPAIWYKPLTASAETPVPGMVWVHGGPGGQTRQSYFPLIQCMVNHGYAVLAVNNRGSSGYGKEFFKLDDLNHGENDLQDCIYGKKWLQEQDFIDNDKIGIIGGSYGGYMTMRAMTHTPDEFKVGVNIFGVTNWLRTLRSIPPWWESFRAALYAELGNPNTADSVRLYEISPLFHADQIKNPIMVLQGANDPRVLQVESDEMVEAAKANGVPVEYVIFEDEGHGFRKEENEIKGYGKIIEFLDQYLKGEEPALTADE